MSCDGLPPDGGPRSAPAHLVLLGVIVSVTVVVAASVGLADAGPEWVAAVILIGLAVVGLVLWWTNSTEKAWDELGRSVLVGVLIAATVGVVQFEIDARQRDRALRLSLSQQGDLTGIDLAKRPLSKAFLAHKVLSYANLQEADLSQASLVESTLVGADLRSANLRHANLRGAYLTGASLDGADLSGADLRGAHLQGARLPNAILAGVKLGGAGLNDACLAAAHLRGANLTSASLHRAVLTNADLRGVTFDDDLRNATLTGAILVGARADKETAWPRTFNPRTKLTEPFDRTRLRAPSVLPQPQMDPAGLSGTPGHVVRVLDGDTVELDNHVPVRLLGINAPPLSDPTGQAAKKRLQALTSSRPVRYLFDPLKKARQDKFGRNLVYLWLDHGVLLNELLIQQGLARESSSASDSAVRFAARLTRATAAARAAGEGTWGSCPSPD